LPATVPSDGDTAAPPAKQRLGYKLQFGVSRLHASSHRVDWLTSAVQLQVCGTAQRLNQAVDNNVLETRRTKTG